MTRNELEVFVASELEEQVDEMSNNDFKVLCDEIAKLKGCPWWNEECVNDNYMSYIVQQVCYNKRVSKPFDRIPRGFRNNNPGNIRLTKSKWVGLCKEQKDGVFCQFIDLKFGFRAMLKLLESYYFKYECRDTRSIIARWAPSSDGNDTGEYIKYVTGFCGVTPAAKLLQPALDRHFWSKFIIAMSHVENGRYSSAYSTYKLQYKACEAWDLLYKEDRS